MSAEQASQRSLWMGDLAAWMDEAFLFGLFQGMCCLLNHQPASLLPVTVRQARQYALG